MSLKHQAFIAALSCVNSDAKKSKTYLNDKRLSFQEKTIVSCFLALRDFENKKIIDILNKLTTTDLFVESQRFQCLGAAYNNLTLFDEAESHLKVAIELNREEGGEIFKMAACQSLFTVYLNKHDQPGMQEALNELKALPLLEKLPICILYSEFCLLVQSMKLDEAKSMLPEMERTYKLFNEHQKISYLYDLFELHLFENNFEDCDLVLERIKKIKKFKNSVHVKYMHSIIQFILKDAPIYLYERDFKDYPLLLHQLQCIQALENGEQAMAMEKWRKLQILNPEVYGGPFEIHGPPNLFAKAIQKFMLKIPSESFEIQLNKNAPKEDQLLYLLKSSHVPLKKEYIYGQLWNEEITSKDDLKKLVKVVQRFRTKHGMNIKSIKGSYVLKQGKSG